MGTTYLGLVNQVLSGRLNETPLTVDNFNSTRGIHTSAKQAVKDAVNKIQNTLFQLTINAAEHRQTLVKGIGEYAWPPGFKNADWNSFYIARNDLLNVNNTKLVKINREQWYNHQKDIDGYDTVNGRGRPSVVFESHGQGFGVSPTPDQEYTISFRYYFHETGLVNALDECSIPSNFDYVIVDGAAYFMKMFKEDTDQADRVKNDFRDGIKDIRNLLFAKDDTLRDTRVPRSFGRGFF